MPSYYQRDRFRVVVYITGPHHVCLQLAFGGQPVEQPELIALRPAGGRPTGLDPERVRAAVVRASTRTNRELNSRFFPNTIAFVPDDSPRYELFEHCTDLLVRRLASGGLFEALSPL